MTDIDKCKYAKVLYCKISTKNLLSVFQKILHIKILYVTKLFYKV